MKIGVTSFNYATKRLIVQTHPDYQYVNIRFNNVYFWKYLHILLLKLLKIIRLNDENFYMLSLKFKPLFFPKRLDILHFFNTVNYSKKVPWVLSVESAVPWNRSIIGCIENQEPDFSVLRNNKEIERSLKQISSNTCKGLLALCDCSKQMQLEILKQFPQYESIIKQKLITLHPPQKLFTRSIRDKKLNYKNGSLRFIFIGRDFFRKGGREMFKAFEAYKSKYDFELTIVSDLRIDEKRYLMKENEVEDSLSYISDNRDWINHYPYVPNERVIQLIQQSHVALLPTWMDTYGYSILECQACGCPVITTKIRAMSEINSENCGWLISVPVNRLNHPIHKERTEFELFRKTLETGLINVLDDVFTNPEKIETKAEKCIERIALYHAPQRYFSILEGVYSGALLK